MRRPTFIPSRLHRPSCVPRTRRPADGFSLIEMLTTMSVLAVLLAIASPGLASLTSANALSSAQGELTAAMMLARGEALKRGVPVGLAATSPLNGSEFNAGWTVFVDANANGILDAGEPIVRVQPAFRGDMHVTTNAGQTLLAFSGRGFLTPSVPVTFTCARPWRPRATASASSRSGSPTSPKRRAAHDRAGFQTGGQGGYVLLEALIAVVIAAVGFIGAARMQTLGLAMNNSTQVRQKATLLGYQMADRIRANQAGVSARAYDLPSAGPTACLVAATGCTPTQLAGADVGEWQSEIATQLPGGTGVVCLDSTPDDGAAAAPLCDGAGNVIAVKLWWVDKVGSPRFVVSVRP